MLVVASQTQGHFVSNDYKMSLFGFGAVSEKDVTLGFGKVHPNQTVSSEVDKASRIFIRSKKKKTKKNKSDVDPPRIENHCRLQ